MNLFLLRHAEAEDFHPDPLRPLSAKGRKDSEELGRLLERKGIHLPQTIWCSPYLRARETIEALLRTTRDQPRVVIRDGLTPYDDPAHLLGVLAAATDDLAIVGHNPFLSDLAGSLLGDASGQGVVHFRKCTLMCFERIKQISDHASPTWVLSWMIPPKLFR